MRSKYLGVTILVVMLAVMVVPTTTYAETKFFAIATGGTAGTYYPLGGALAQALSSKIEDLEVTAQTGNASVANCNLINDHEIESAFVQNNVAYWAYTATGVFEGKEPIENLRAIASLYPEVFQLVATKSSGIKSFADLKGKRVSPGDRGSGTESDFRSMTKVLGMSYDDFGSVDYLSLGGAVERMKDGQVDFLIFTGGYPTSGIIDLGTSVDLTYISIPDEERAKIKEALPYVIELVIPAGTYPGQEEDVKTLSVVAQWVVDADVSDDLVYEITKALWEKGEVKKGSSKGQMKTGAEIMAEVHAKGKEVTLETALAGNAIPLHAGAEKYYKEIGVVK
ncbi:TRAP transporter solute receptor, TAXI family [Candidatus Vecturithrix granuli]|uniref:TRAP transporter solute receptor, TAXI family n=1 Tax=Vecturithrix granuli TaxID=1499967 RepID=A0A081BX50_VECG1|nr:TRAP transporter solute receptor, TAXI family [Candidatus Vecturithrix granuli]